MVLCNFYYYFFLIAEFDRRIFPPISHGSRATNEIWCQTIFTLDVITVTHIAGFTRLKSTREL